MCAYIYIYIYMFRERERKSDIYIYIYIYREREIYMHMSWKFIGGAVQVSNRSSQAFRPEAATEAVFISINLVGDIYFETCTQSV